MNTEWQCFTMLIGFYKYPVSLQFNKQTYINTREILCFQGKYNFKFLPKNTVYNCYKFS